jgi:hypothetical protein
LITLLILYSLFLLAASICEHTWGWVFLTALAAVLVVGTCKGESPPPQTKCQSALSACNDLVNVQDAQITLLKAEVADYRKRVDEGLQNTPITLYTVLGGALAGGTIGLVREGGQQGLLQAITGAGVGAILGAVLEELVK